jgi:hypothetical protein
MGSVHTVRRAIQSGISTQRLLYSCDEVHSARSDSFIEDADLENVGVIC